MDTTHDFERIVDSLKEQLEALGMWGVAQMPTSRGASESRMTIAPPGMTAATRRGDERSAKIAALAALRQEVAGCTRCALSTTRTQAVFGEGNPDAELVFLGEAPGHDEDVQGQPFVGAAGQLLTKMIAAMGLSREQVYICNVLKSRPPGNRTPQPEEVEACRPFLAKQLAIIQPRIICALGAVAAKALLGPTVSITQIRGQFRSYQGIPVLPTYHPAYLLRNPSAKPQAWQDLKAIKRFLDVPPPSGDETKRVDS